MDATAIEQQMKMLLTNYEVGVKLEMKLPNGETFSVTREPDQPQQYTTQHEWLEAEYSDLLDTPITLTEAAQKYDVPRSAMEYWVYGAKYMQPLDSSAYPKTFNEALVAFLVDIYNIRRETGSKAPLINDNGLPYELKHPELAAYRRSKKSG